MATFSEIGNFECDDCGESYTSKEEGCMYCSGDSTAVYTTCTKCGGLLSIVDKECPVCGRFGPENIHKSILSEHVLHPLTECLEELKFGRVKDEQLFIQDMIDVYNLKNLNNEGDTEERV